MAGGRRGDAKRAERHRLPPVELDRRDAAPAQGRAIAEHRHHMRRVAALQRAKARQVHVIVMVVRQQDHVRARQLGQDKAGRADALRTGPGHRRAAPAEHRVGQHDRLGQADQERRVIDEADRRRALRDRIRRRRKRRVARLRRPGGTLALASPAQKLPQSVRRRAGAGVEEALAVVMVRQRARAGSRGRHPIRLSQSALAGLRPA